MEGTEHLQPVSAKIMPFQTNHLVKTTWTTWITWITWTTWIAWSKPLGQLGSLGQNHLDQEMNAFQHQEDLRVWEIGKIFYL